MSALGLYVGELQRVTAQLEEAVAEQRHYTADDRASLASAFSDLACRLELCRCAIVDPESSEVGRR